MVNTFGHVPVVILCGGQGVVLGEGQLQRLNKALVPLDGKPLVWWVMVQYALQGARDFLLPVGLQADRFRGALCNDCGARADPSEPDIYHLEIAGVMRRLRVLTTSVQANTAERLLACKPLLAVAPRFAVTYSDTLSDVDLGAEFDFHAAGQTVATLVSTQCPVRFRILGMRQGENLVRAFATRPVIEAAAINGGYYLFTTRLWEPAYGLDGSAALESATLEKLVIHEQLTAFEHRGAWQHCDTVRDLAPLARITQILASRLAQAEIRRTC